MTEILILTDAEKCIFESTRKFHINYYDATPEEALKQAEKKIIQIRKMSAEISNPKSKSYFPY